MYIDILRPYCVMGIKTMKPVSRQKGKDFSVWVFA